MEILRDRAGVPHVYAGSTADLYFGLGFATAQDRLWQLDRLRRRALGRQAEVLGPDYARSDLIHRLVGIEEIARAEAGRLDERTREIVTAYVAGINHHLEQVGASPATLPIEFDLLGYACPPFTVADVLAILRGMWWSLNGRLEGLVAAEAARLLPEGPLRDLYLTPEAPETRILPPGSPLPPAGLPLPPPNDLLAGSGDATGSNNWAIDPRRSATGQAFLCSDPHQPFWLPSSWYEYASARSRGQPRGAGHPGVPGLWWGSNGDLAWGVTNNAASTRDLYSETVHPQDPGRYRDGETWRPFETREVSIAVRGEAPRRHTLRATVRGPVMNDVLPTLQEGEIPRSPCAGWGRSTWTTCGPWSASGGPGPGRPSGTPYGTGRCRCSTSSAPAPGGQIGYQCAGRVPLRGRVRRGFREGGHPQDAWQGYVPFDALPRLEQPARGYVASANNRAVQDGYPYPLYGAWAPGTARRAWSRPCTTSNASPREEMIALQNDVSSARAAASPPPSGAGCGRRARATRTWPSSNPPWGPGTTATPCRAHPDSVRDLQPGLAAPRRRRALPAAPPPSGAGAGQRRRPAPGGGRPGVVPRPPGPRFRPDGDGPGSHGRGAPALGATTPPAGAGSGCTWPTGATPSATPPPPPSSTSARPPWTAAPTPCATPGLSPSGSADSGAEYRLVVDFSQPDHFLACQNAGNSGQPGSPHYGDGFAPWIAGEYHVVHLRRGGGGGRPGGAHPATPHGSRGGLASRPAPGGAAHPRERARLPRPAGRGRSRGPSEKLGIPPPGRSPGRRPGRPPSRGPQVEPPDGRGPRRPSPGGACGTRRPGGRPRRAPGGGRDSRGRGRTAPGPAPPSGAG